MYNNLTEITINNIDYNIIDNINEADIVVYSVFYKEQKLYKNKINIFITFEPLHFNCEFFNISLSHSINENNNDDHDSKTIINLSDNVIELGDIKNVTILKLKDDDDNDEDEDNDADDFEELSFAINNYHIENDDTLDTTKTEISDNLSGTSAITTATLPPHQIHTVHHYYVQHF
jgi:hypothetical protein